MLPIAEAKPYKIHINSFLTILEHLEARHIFHDGFVEHEQVFHLSHQHTSQSWTLEVQRISLPWHQMIHFHGNSAFHCLTILWSFLERWKLKKENYLLFKIHFNSINNFERKYIIYIFFLHLINWVFSSKNFS